VRDGRSPDQGLLRHYFSTRSKPWSLELGDTPQEQTVGHKDDRRRITIRDGPQFAGKQALAEFLAELLKEEKRPGK
jgi:hypothetical protein